MEYEHMMICVGVALMLSAGSLGFSLGHSMGVSRACESVKMEWFKDKCAQVTREEMK